MTSLIATIFVPLVVIALGAFAFAYMSPEQARIRSFRRHRADLRQSLTNRRAQR